MKKIVSIFLCAAMILFLCPCQISSVCTAAANPVPSNAPEYDAAFDNNMGAFFANGTPVTIKTDGTDTVITWKRGSQIVPDTVRVFGGGRADTNFMSSDITMLSGTVKHIYGGGFSLDETKPALVKEAVIKIHGGEVTAGVYGGGLFYSETTNTTISVGNGILQSVAGGGASSGTIDGQTYNSGTREQPELSGTRVSSADITINDGIISTLWGGGQGYSFTKDVRINVFGGDIEYITAGGSNGLTNTAITHINGGNISIYQSVNRGTLKAAETVLTGGRVETFYVGGETVPDVTGILNNADIRILGGITDSLNAGTSNGAPLDTTLSDYDILFVEGIVINNNISKGADSFTFTIAFDKDEYHVRRLTPFKPQLIITTTPSGFESIIEKEVIEYTSSDDSLVMINSSGTVIGLENGTAQIHAQLFDHDASASVNVFGPPLIQINTIIIIALILISINILLVIILNFRRICRYIMCYCRRHHKK